MKGQTVAPLAVLFAAALLLLPFSSASAASKILKSGETWEISQTTTLSSLAIAEGAGIEAPKDHTVTLTVDGIGTAIAPGTYTGDVVLTVNEAIEMGGGMPGGGGGMPEGGMPGGSGGPPGGPGGDMPAGGPPMDAAGGPPGGGMSPLPGGEAMPQGGSNAFRAAVYVEDGKYVPEKSVAAMVTDGSVNDTAARDVKIASTEGKFNGIIVTGDTRSVYAIENPEITLTGNGGDDASGLGHGIMASGHAEVFIDNARINNTGANRSAVFVSGDGVVHVNNSEIEVHNGPTEATSSSFNAGGVMMAGPWLLGITGNCRATNVVERGTAYYTDTHIKSQAWGALSTDGPEKVRLTATRCLVETVESGYGAYSIGNCINTYSDCIFNVVDYGIILCDNSTDIVTDGTVINSKRIGVMMHTGSGSGRLVIDKGSVFNTRDTVIQVKGRGIDILVDHAALNTESGVILHSMANDDPFFVSGMGDTMGEQGYNKDVNAIIRNTALDGDIINSYTAVSPVNVTFENASITGAITTATTEQPTGPDGETLSMQTPELYYLIGQTINTYCARFEDPFGVSVTLDESSAWVVDQTSYLTHLSIAETGSVSAPAGYQVTMTVNGEATPLDAGTYDGDIVLTVVKM